MSNELLHTPECFSQHIGLYMADSEWLNQATAAIRSGMLKPRFEVAVPRISSLAVESRGDELVNTSGGGSYTRLASGIAIFHITGPTMKGFSKYGGTSTVAMRSALRAARDDDMVTAGLMIIDSPGGHAAGQQQLGDEIAAFSAAKPMAAHGEDLIASAAFWSASQAGLGITANRAAEVGSIGTFTVLVDSSGAAEMQGLKVIPVATGAHKGQGAAGTELTEDYIEQVRDRVEAINAHFLEAVSVGRNMTTDQVSAVADGRVFPASKALSLGLIDGIDSLDAVLARMESDYGRKAQSFAPSRGSRSRMLAAQIGQELQGEN